jgi:hypothetical protein
VSTRPAPRLPRRTPVARLHLHTGPRGPVLGPLPGPTGVGAPGAATGGTIRAAAGAVGAGTAKRVVRVSSGGLLLHRLGLLLVHNPSWCTSTDALAGSLLSVSHLQNF